MELRLFVFHHAGGSHLPYRDWPSRLPADWDVRLMDAPGRGLLSDRPALGDADRLVDHFLSVIGPEVESGPPERNVPYALFGHSMGGLIAYELTLRMLAEGRTPPIWLGLSARGTPRTGHAPGTRHLLSDDALRRELAAMGGTPAAVLEDPELWELFAPAIRCDLKLVETWRPTPAKGPLPVPLSVYGGRDDPATPPARLDGWAERSTRFLGQHLFDGGHFYFQPDPGALLARVTADVERARTRSSTRSSPSGV